MDCSRCELRQRQFTGEQYRFTAGDNNVCKEAKTFLKEIEKVFINSAPLKRAFLKIDFMDKDSLYDVKDEIWNVLIGAVGEAGRLEDPYATYHKEAGSKR